MSRNQHQILRESAGEPFVVLRAARYWAGEDSLHHGVSTIKFLAAMSCLDWFVDASRMNTNSFSWANQVEYFGNDPNCSILVFDNRGVGNSGAPFGPYTLVF